MSANEHRTLMHRAMPFLLGGSLVKQILIGLILGIVVALVSPSVAVVCGFLGTLFVSAFIAVQNKI